MQARLATTADDDLLKSIVMHPNVRQWNEFDGARVDFDPAKYTAARNSFAVVIEDKLGPVGCFLAFAVEACAYCVHTCLLPGCRGARAVDAATEALRFAFVETDAEQLWTMVPDCNPKALWFAHAMRFRDAYKREGSWLEHGAKHDVRYLRLDLDDWVLGLSMCDLGERFHERLTALGGHVDHVYDPVHSAYVGTAWAMTAAGRLGKGMWVYGRWARVAGYQPYSVLSNDPLRIDIGSHVLRADGGTFTIEEPRHA